MDYQNIYNGKLDMDNNGDFIIHIDSGIVNITGILEEIYSPNSLKDSQVHIKIMRGSSTLFDEQGGLYKKVDEDGIMSFHVCGVNLDYVMFYNTGEILEIVVVTQRGKYIGNGDSR